MTTTADKALLVSLAQTSLKLEGQMKHLEESLMRQKEDLEKLQQSIESADPEPMECWIEAFSPQGGKYFGSKDDVLASKHHNRFTVPIHMREVTPQDEQDRKDAERYRFLKETKQGRDLLMPGYRETWDEIIDHAMVDEMIDKAMEEV